MLLSYSLCHSTFTQVQSTPAERRRITHNSCSMSRRVCAMLAILLITMQQAHARSSQREVPAGFNLEQEPVDRPYEGENRGGGVQRIENIMYDLLQHAAEQQQHEQEQQDQQQQEQEQEHREEGEHESYLEPPEALMMDDPTVNADKRGSYMSLCHFKICNMGRKRTLRRQQWNRY